MVGSARGASETKGRAQSRENLKRFSKSRRESADEGGRAAVPRTLFFKVGHQSFTRTTREFTSSLESLSDSKGWNLVKRIRRSECGGGGPESFKAALKIVDYCACSLVLLRRRQSALTFFRIQHLESNSVSGSGHFAENRFELILNWPVRSARQNRTFRISSLLTDWSQYFCETEPFELVPISSCRVRIGCGCSLQITAAQTFLDQSSR